MTPEKSTLSASAQPAGGALDEASVVPLLLILGAFVALDRADHTLYGIPAMAIVAADVRMQAVARNIACGGWRCR